MFLNTKRFDTFESALNYNIIIKGEKQVTGFGLVQDVRLHPLDVGLVQDDPNVSEHQNF